MFHEHFKWSGLEPGPGFSKPGPVSRWNTTSSKICRIYVSKHGLKGNTLRSLKQLVEFIVGVYFPCWFQAKVQNSWIEGPRHILFQLECLRSQRQEVIDIVTPVVKRSAWFAHSENIIQTLLCSEDNQGR